MGNVYYGYDVRGDQLYARFDNMSGEGITNAYDGFGRLSSTTTNMGGTSRTLSYQYDADGNRTQLSYPDSAQFTFSYDGLDRPTLGNQPDGAQEFALTYDAQGRRATRNSAFWASYGYDPVGRLSSLSEASYGSQDWVFASTFQYNPAGQMVGATRDNDRYAFSGYASATTSYTPNGLNQYTAVGAGALGYDANGNLASTGGTSLTYDVENRLVSASGTLSANLVYDPLGRLWQSSGGAYGTTQFVYDGDQLVAEYDGGGTLLRRYIHGPGEDEPFVWYEGAGTNFNSARFLKADHQGSIVAWTDISNQSYQINSYDEYGVPGSGNVGRF